MTPTEIANRLALKELVDTFSTLADSKDVEAQLDLFKEDASVLSITNGETFLSEGKEAIATAFKNYLDLFHTVYHINGQQTLHFDSDTQATGISYCQVVLIQDDGTNKIMTTSGVRYQDTYEKIEGSWLIAERKSHFMWTKIDKLDN